MTPDQRRFLNSLSPEKRQQFARMPESQKNAIFSKYTAEKGGIKSRGMTKPRGKSRDGLLSYATRKFGNEGINYLNKNYGTFESNLAGSSAAATVSGLSSFLGSGGDVKAGLRSGATTLGMDYLRKTADDYITEFASGKGAEAFGEAMGRGDVSSAQLAGDTASSNWDTGLSAGLSGGLAGATSYLQTGDVGEAAKKGAMAGAKSALTDYGAKYVAQNAYKTAITAGATKAAATTAASNAASTWTPYIGAGISLATALTDGKMTKRKAAETAGEIGVAAIGAATTPVVGWVWGAAKAAQAIGKNVIQNKGRNQRVFIGLDADTGKANVSFGGKMTPDDFHKLRPEAVAKIEKIVNEKSRRQQKVRDQFIDSLPPEERQSAWLLLQGSEAKIGLSGKDIEKFNTDEWINANNMEDYISGDEHSGIWFSEKMDDSKDLVRRAEARREDYNRTTDRDDEGKMSRQGKWQYDWMRKMGVKGALEPTEENIARVPDKYKSSNLGLDSASSSSDYLRMPSSAELEKKSTMAREIDLPDWAKEYSEERIKEDKDIEYRRSRRKMREEKEERTMSTVDTDV